MPAIRFGGMASGLPPNIVDQIMDAERIPEKTMEASKAKEEDKLKLVGDLETKVNDVTKNLGELVNTRGFSNMKLTSGDNNVIDGTVDPNVAQSGEWELEVTQLAQKPGAMTNGFPDKDKTQIGVGYLRFETPNGKKEVYINKDNSTLQGVANMINQSGDGLRAMIVDDRSDKDNPYKMIVTGLKTGDDMQVKFPSIYMLDGDQDIVFDKSLPAKNAKVKVDGFEIELPENKISDLIPGASLNIKKADPGHPIRINIKEDTEAVGGKIKSFVDALNGSLAFIQAQHRLTKGPDGNQHLGPLGGDGMIRQIESSLRGLVLDPQMGTGSTIRRLDELGIEFNRNGTLEFNQQKFNKILNTNPENVAKFFRGDGVKVGMVPVVQRTIQSMVDNAYGPISNRKRSIQSKIKSIDDRIDSKERQLAMKEENLRKKFANLEEKMSELKSQGAAVGGIAAAGMGGMKQS
jgi:flagellar hook-associated protein 2